jgi:Acyl-CoA thioesterase C-terminal domain/Acyl-CoA thioesterase N-terminal domain
MADAIFTRPGDGTYTASEHARGPWDPNALHGGASAALIAGAFERAHPGSQLLISRLGFEFLKPVRFEPLALSTRIVRDGMRVQELAAELRAGSELICRASALRIQAVPTELPRSGPPPAEPMPGPDQGEPLTFSFDDATAKSLATTGMEMRWLSDPRRLGPGRVWMRPRRAFLGEEETTPLMRLAAAADFGNGVSTELAFDEYLFVNADLNVYLWRQPQGEWIGLDSRTLLHAGGMGISESVLHDTLGPVGRSFQTLVVQPR